MSSAAVESLADRLLQALGHPPTEGQRRAADALHRLLATDRSQATLVLKGYAGTGKTTLVGALVRVLAQQRRRVVLLAPTGRAAKVLGAYAQASASTIHRRIYRVSADEDDGWARPGLAPNKDAGALFVVDEASMIGSGGGEGGFGDRDLLRDLFEHVFSAPDCKLLLIGIRPVAARGTDHSPALDIKGLRAVGPHRRCGGAYGGGAPGRSIRHPGERHRAAGHPSG
ncbi:MAG: AAA family ATPase [Flavobacteriales bacterium]|nr:AAA family ATPase [Flavobacteriales bacterium]